VFAIVLALVVIVYMLSWAVHRESTARIPVILEPEPAIVEGTQAPIERRIADRTFVLQGEVWVEKPLLGIEPVATLESSDDRLERWLAESPQRRELSELGARVRLLIDGQVFEIRFEPR
jgi:hypothetical protein